MPSLNAFVNGARIGSAHGFFIGEAEKIYDKAGLKVLS